MVRLKSHYPPTFIQYVCAGVRTCSNCAHAALETGSRRGVITPPLEWKGATNFWQQRWSLWFIINCPAAQDAGWGRQSVDQLRTERTTKGLGMDILPGDVTGLTGNGHFQREPEVEGWDGDGSDRRTEGHRRQTNFKLVNPPA